MIQHLEQCAWRTLRADQQKVISFFAVMSRFEYAVKMSGWVRDDRRTLMADWDKFGEYLNEFFGEDVEPEDLKNAIDYLIQHPPKILNAHNAWQPKPPRGVTRLAQALDSVTRVRNNLFHGRKGDDQMRNDMLIDYSLVFLQAVLAVCRNVREKYESEA